MTNTTIKDIDNKQDTLKCIPNDTIANNNNKDRKQTTTRSLLTTSQEKQVCNSTNKSDILINDQLSVATSLIGCLVKITLKNGTCFKGTLFNGTNVDKLQLTLTMAEEIQNGETVGQIKNALNLYGHEITNIQALNTDNQLDKQLYSKNINLHTLSDTYQTTNENLNPTLNSSDKVNDIIKEKENLYRNSYNEKHDHRNSINSIKKSAKYNQQNSNESSQQVNKSNKQVNKMQRRFNNHYQDSYSSQSTVNKTNKTKKSPTHIEMNTTTPSRKSMKSEKMKSNYNNDLQPYRNMMNNNSNSNKKGNHPIYSDISVMNQMTYQHSALPSYPPSPYYFQWYSSMNNNIQYHYQYQFTNERNNNDNNTNMVNQLPLNDINQRQQQQQRIQAKNTMENEKKKSNKKIKNESTETNTLEKKSSFPKFKFNTKATEFKPNHLYHHTLLDTSDKLNDNNGNDKNKNTNEMLNLNKNNNHLFMKDVYHSPFSKFNSSAPNQVDPLWPYGKYSYKIEYQPPLMYVVQDFHGYIHFIYPYCPFNIINTQQGLLNKSYPMIQSSQSEQK
ncbi:unnamed protein product [Cunninghamella blakesleeana]